MSTSIVIDDKYREWIADISKRFRQSQIKAAMKVNDEMLRFFWSLGFDMHVRKDTYIWGSHFYEQVSKDLKKSIPGTKSFSQRNLLYMHQFYRMFPKAGIVNHVDSQLNETEVTNQIDSQLTTKESSLSIPEEQYVFYIPWGHIKAIMGKCKNSEDKALFFVRKTFENSWSRAVLLNFLDTDLYERQGKAISNFGKTLPVVQGELAQAITKDPYNFDSSYAGKLGTYVVAVNHQLKEDWMNPTLGLLVCKGMDKVEAQYALEASTQPIGVSGYELSKLIPEKYKGSLPTIEEIEAELENIEIDAADLK